MAAETSYFVVEYDNEVNGPFVAEGNNLTWAGGVGFIITVVDFGSTGKLQCALISGVRPVNNEQLTQGTTTADTNGPAPNGDSEVMLYPAYFRQDVAVAQSGATTWTGPALGATHSFLFDGQTANVVVGEILTFSGGQECEVITVVSDAGASGELDVRWISFLDDLQFPDDNDTFTGDLGGDGVLNGRVHPRAYTPLHLHRLYADLNDDRIPEGDDFLAVYDADPSAKDTDQIVRLLNVTVTDEVTQHMFGGSIEQNDGRTLYSGWNLQIVDPDGETRPVLIQNDAIITDYWKNAYNPDSIQGRVRILIKTREDGVNIDGRRVSGKILRYGFNYFLGTTTLGTAVTGLTLFTGSDGNNQTAEGTVAGAPYNTIVITEGYQEIDFNNGNGLTPYALSFDLGSATKSQAYERWKYISREDTAETLFGRNAVLVTGVNLDWAYDNEVGTFQEDEVIAWGTEIPYVAEQAGEVWQVDVTGPTFSDQTAGFNDATDANFTPFPGTEEVGDYCAIGFSEKFNKAVFDNLNGTAGVGGVVVWEYWDGTAWSALSGVTDGTTGFTAAAADGQVLTFTAPANWETTSLNAGAQLYYIRARITTVYSTNPIYDQGFITGTFTLNEVVWGASSGARGRIVYIDAATETTGTILVAQDGSTAFSNGETITGQTGGGSVETGTVVTNSAFGRALLMALDDNGVDGFHYMQSLAGTNPANNQKVFGETSLATALVNGTVSTRVINVNLYVGQFTGSDFNPTNHGIALDPTDAGASDRLVNLNGVAQAPPNNQQGSVAGGEAGDYLTVYPWDGTTNDTNGFPEPNFNEATLATALVAATSTTVEVDVIPVNTPDAGFLRVQRDSDGELDLLEYVSFSGTTYTLGGSTPTAPNAAAIGNTVMRAFIDKVLPTTGSHSYTAVQTGSNQVAIKLLRGGANPIKPGRATATFGASGFSASVNRISDA